MVMLLIIGARLYNGFVNKGHHKFKWDAKNLRRGIYFVEIKGDMGKVFKRFIKIY